MNRKYFGVLLGVIVVVAVIGMCFLGTARAFGWFLLFFFILQALLILALVKMYRRNTLPSAVHKREKQVRDMFEAVGSSLSNEDFESITSYTFVDENWYRFVHKMIADSKGFAPGSTKRVKFYTTDCPDHDTILMRIYLTCFGCAELSPDFEMQIRFARAGLVKVCELGEALRKGSNDNEYIREVINDNLSSSFSKLTLSIVRVLYQKGELR